MKPEGPSSEKNMIWPHFAMGAILIALFTIGVCLPQRAYAESSQKVNYVMVGDSYSIISKSYGVTKAWPERVSGLLGLTNEQYTVYRRGGYGFARKGKHLISLLTKAKRNKGVTAVLIVGGAGNDRFRSLAEIKFWYKKTMKRIRFLYPNAVIMHTITSWDRADSDYRKRVSSRIPFYKRLARDNGVVYLNGCAKVLRNKSTCFCSDNRHPNDRGQKLMSRAIAKAIKRLHITGTVSVGLKASSTS